MSIMKYPIKCKGGDPILTPYYDVITLQEINDKFLSPSISIQMELCKRLGITINKESINVIVKEKGRAYEMPDEDRTIISENETNYEFQLTFAVANCENKFPLPFSINFNGCSEQMFVNFYGEIVFLNDKQETVSVPLIGRGTVALEGRENDAHIEPCIGGRCASFQQKVALLLSLLAYFHLTRDDIEVLRAHLLKDCDKFYGRNDIINYTCDKAFSLTKLSYYEYLKIRYSNEDEENIPIILQHFIDFAEPHPLYFECLKETLTPEELNKELKDTSNDPSGPDKNPITPRVREIINKLILLDEIYMIKSYPGENFKYNGNKEISIYELEKCFNSYSVDSVKSALGRLGVIIIGEKISIKFSEHNTIRDINAKEETEEICELELSVSSLCLDSLLSLKMYLDINPIDRVNFFGKLEIKDGLIFKTTVPLLGRGTIALDGILNDKYAGFCTGSRSATFQQRVAIIYSALVVLNVKESDLQRFEFIIRHINKKLYGLQDIIDYTFNVAKKQETESFFQYMKATHMNYSKMPIVLKTILTYNRLPPKYFEGLISTFSEKELIEEEKRLQSIRFSNIIPKIVRRLSNIFAKINIF